MMSNPFKEIVQNGYDAIADSYHARRQSGSMVWFEQFIPMFKGNRLLDAGCGAGVPVAKFFAEKGFEVTGIDISEGMLRIARKEVPGATFVNGDIVSLPFNPHSFDTIISMFAIIHVPRESHQLVLKEFYRTLKIGGILILSTGVTDNIMEVKDNWYGATMFWSHFDREKYIQLAKDAGFNILFSETGTTRSGEEHFYLVCERQSDE